MELAAEAIRAQVERLLLSKAFETSEVHRRLLTYLAEKTLAGESDRLKEYIVGLEAFGKPPSYDPKHDSIVRLQVGRLRQKIAAYYQEEAHGDTILVSLPKGGFRLQFEEMPAGENGVPPVPVTAPAGRRPTLLLAAALAAAVVWAGAASVQLLRAHRDLAVITDRWNPELEALWAPFLHADRSVLVCLGTPTFVRFTDYGFFRDPNANSWEEVQNSERMNTVRHALPARDIYPWYAFTGAGEASAAISISKLLATRKREILVTRSNLLSWQQVTDSDVVFVGPPKFNPQLQAAALNYDIVVEPKGVRNLKPRPGEPVYLEDRIVTGRQAEGETHALITFTRGLSGVGDMLILGGNASADTMAAGEWLTQPWRARELVQRLRNSRGELPASYQVVIKVVFRQGIPVRSSYVFHHVLQP
jgi:hypothetical protein